MILAIDPGNVQSAYVVYEGGRIYDKGIVPNSGMLNKFQAQIWGQGERVNPHRMLIEMVASYGMPVGKEIFDTVLWIGRFVQAWPREYELVYRKDVKLSICGNPAAKDSNIRQALIDRFGPGKSVAVGVKKKPGPLYGVEKDIWSALAIAVHADPVDRRGIAR